LIPPKQGGSAGENRLGRILPDLDIQRTHLLWNTRKDIPALLLWAGDCGTGGDSGGGVQPGGVRCRARNLSDIS